MTGDEIDRVVARFYGQVRHHQTLGDIFAAHVKDWPAHEAKIARFWRNAILHERGYDANPMQAHLSAGNVCPHHFVPWLALFDAVLEAEVPQAAQAWSALAHRIGRGLRYGLEFAQAKAGDVPQL